MAKTKYGEIKCSNVKYDCKINAIIEELEKKRNPREIANKLKVPFGVVDNIQKRIKSIQYSMKNKNENNLERDNTPEELQKKEEVTKVETQSVPTIEPDAEESKEETKEEKLVSNISKYKGTEIAGKREKLSDDVVLRMLEMFELKIPKTQVAEELGIAYSTVLRYAKEYGYTNMKKGKRTNKNRTSTNKRGYTHGGKGRKIDSTNKTKNNVSNGNERKIPGEDYARELEKKASNNKNSNTNADALPDAISNDIGDRNESYREDVVCVGLVKDRHDMPVEKFIFDKVQESVMFKYEELDKIVVDFIKNEVGLKKDKETGELVGTKSLVVYVTGLTCCIGSVIKICHNYSVNLTLMHYNIKNGEYYKQVIWNSFGKGYINTLFNNATEINLHDITIEEMRENRFYVMRTVKLHETIENEVIFDVFKDQVDLWIHHGKVLSVCMLDTTCRIAVYVDYSELVDEKVVSVNKITSVYNWSKSEK